MKTQSSLVGTTCRETMAVGSRTIRAGRLLPLLLVLGLTTAAQGQFNSYVDNGTVTIIGYTGPGVDVVIPDTINGLPVTRIGEAAFSGCTGLRRVTIPDSVTSIGVSAFSGCVRLTSVTIGNSVTSIGGWAFQYCTSLTSVTIPNSVTNIGESALVNCAGLTAITVDALNPVYSSLDGVLFDKNQTALIQCPGGRAETYTIPDSVTSIEGSAFWGCSGLTSVAIPNSVTNIGSGAFSGCSRLTSITIPDSVTSIGYGVFSGCTGLTTVKIPDSATSIASGAFDGCTSLSRVTIPDSVTSIGGAAFSGCTSLTSVTIPDSVTSIGAFAFSGCTGLSSVTIPDGVTSIEPYAFRSCSSLTSITIPDSVTSIGLQAFSGCTGLTDVTIGNSVTSIGPSAFGGCTGLTRVTIPYSVKSFDSRAFSGCSNLTSMRFEGNAPSLGSDVFEGISATVYYNPRTAGWNETFGGLPTVPADQELVFAGLTIRGEVGRVYSVECLGVLAESSESTWRCLEFLQLPASPYWWTDKSALATRNRFYRAVTMEPPANMVFIPPGTFRMGSLEDGPQTSVIISHGFWMGKYEVTQGEYLAVMGNNPSHFNGVRIVEDSETDYGSDLNRPVEMVSWNDAVAYCTALTQRERLAGRIPAGSAYRLPTEAEWEYACRAWTSTRFSYGDDPDFADLTNYAWYGGNSDGTTHPVGQKLPNPWGLYDIHGNASEWCQDWWSESLPGGIVVDPQNSSSWSSFGRVVRGGDGYVGVDPLSGAYSCRSADRSLSVPPDYAVDGFIGLRVVLAPVRP